MYRLFILILLAGLYSCETYIKEEDSTQSEKILKKETLVDSFLIEILEKYDPSFFIDSAFLDNERMFTIEIEKEIVNKTLYTRMCDIADVYKKGEVLTAEFHHLFNFCLQLEIDSIQLKKVMYYKDANDIYDKKILFFANSIVKVHSIYKNEDDNFLIVKLDDFEYLIEGKLIEIFLEDEKD